MEDTPKDRSLTQDRDALVGKNVARLRLSTGTSQKEVAEEMRSVGHKWSQNTVWNVEHGERPLRLAEAASLCDVLGVPVAALLADPLNDDSVSAELVKAAAARQSVLAVAADVQEAVARALSRWQSAIAKFDATHGHDRTQRALVDATHGHDIHLSRSQIDQFADDLRALALDPTQAQYNEER